MCISLAVIAQEATPSAENGDSQPAVETTIQAWLGSYDNYNDESLPYGCGNFLLPVDTGIPRSGDTQDDLRLALEALLDPDFKHPEVETEAWLREMSLSVDTITIDDGDAVVMFGGTLIGPGHCGDALIEGQILQTIFQFEAIERVMVSDGETNLWEMIDLTDWYSDSFRDNYFYERPRAEAEAIKFWVGSFEDYETEGIAYGCGSYLLPVETGISRSGNPQTDLRLALEALFNPALKHPEAETEDWLKGLELSVEAITLAQGEADIKLGGKLIGIGSCGDAIMEGRILETVFQFDYIERVRVSDGETNLREIVDQSDTLSDEERRNYLYERTQR